MDTACLVAGTTKECVDYWKRLYENGVEHAQKYADFFSALKRASALAESESLEDIKSGRQGWQGQAWFLERRHYKRWGSKHKVDVTQTTKAEPVIVELPKKNGKDKPSAGTTGRSTGK